MGYNGNNRKLRSSVIKKSSLRLGTKVISNMLAWPVAIAASVVIDSMGRTKINETPHSLCDNKDFDIDEIISKYILTDKEYNYIKQSYKEKITINTQIDLAISDLKKKIRKDNILLSLIGFVPFFKRKLSAKVFVLKEKIHSLALEKKNIEIDIQDIECISESETITFADNSCMYLVFSPVYDYCNVENKYSIVRGRLPFFTFNIPNIVSFNFGVIQICFYNSLLIIATKKDFAIINYSHIKASLQIVHVIENQIEDNINYVEVKTTWLHTCLDGTPDLRYRYNPKVYDLSYWNLSIKLHDSFNFSILFTEKTVAQAVYNLIIGGKLETAEHFDTISNDYNVNNISDEIPANISDAQKRLCDIIKQVGIQPNKYITKKKPQLGSYVKRRRDQAILCVIGISPRQEFTCFDFMRQECYVYKKEDLLLY